MKKYRKIFFSRGKLLLTGEYLILYGALGIALPTIKGQYLIVSKKKSCSSSIIHWKSYDNFNNIWFEAIFNLPYLEIFYKTEDSIAFRLKRLLLKSKKIQKKFLCSFNLTKIKVKTKIEFPMNWGLGSSSTLINNIAKWAKINPFKLIGGDFPGSGYDTACVSKSKPIIYQFYKKNPHIVPIKFNPPFKDKLFFLYLNKKQNTYESIQFFYSKENFFAKNFVNSISSITLKILYCKTLEEFEKLLLKHEKIISKLLNIPTIKEKYFPDYLGLVKSLGSWGGDFALISFRKGMKNYFYNKGYHTIISFDKMIF